MPRFLSLAEAVESTIRDGDTVALEGFTHLVPYAAGHEIIRQRRRRLTLIRMTPDLIYDQLIGMGCAEKLVFSWVGNPGVGSLHRFRDAYENGWPVPITIEEHSHAAMANAYEAGAAGLPCAIFRGYLGVDLPNVNPNIKRITCPFTGEALAAVPAIRPDVAVVHALKADAVGNVLIEGIVGVQKEVVLASKRSLVTVEEIVPEFGERSPNAVILPSWTVGSIACVPGGAHPSYAHGYYKRDNAYYKAWDAITRDRVPGLIIGVVALVVAVRIGGMRAARHAGDAADGPARQDHRIGAALAEIRNDLLDRHQRAFRGQHHLLLHADDAFDQHVAGGVRLERVHHRDVGPDRRHGRERFAGERACDALDVGIDVRQVDPEIAAEDRARQPGRAGLVGIGHGGVGMLLDRDRHRPAVLVGVAETMQRADARIAHPRENQLLGAAHAD